MLRAINIKDILIDRNGSLNYNYSLVNESYRTNAGQYSVFSGSNTRVPGNVLVTETINANNPVLNNLYPAIASTMPYGLKHNFQLTVTLPGLYENSLFEFKGPDDPVNTPTKTHNIFFKAIHKANLIYKFDGVIRPLDGSVQYINRGPSLNPIHEIDWTGSFAEVGIDFSVARKRILGNVFIYDNAILGTDYEIVSSTSTTRRIRFLRLGEFRVRVVAKGYTSDDNPYPNSSGSADFMNRTNSSQSRKILSNSAMKTMEVIVYEEVVVGPEPTIVDDIKYPKISANLVVTDPNYLVNSNPLTTFVLTDVDITPSIDYLSASYVRSTDGVPTNINLNNSQWFDKCVNELNIDLLIINSRLNIHELISDIDLNDTITYGFYPDDNYEVYYNIRLK